MGFSVLVGMEVPGTEAAEIIKEYELSSKITSGLSEEELTESIINKIRFMGSEEVGKYVISTEEIKSNGEYQRSLRLIGAAIVKVRLLSKRVDIVHDDKYLTVRAEAIIDSGLLEKHYKSIHRNEVLNEKLNRLSQNLVEAANKNNRAGKEVSNVSRVLRYSKLLLNTEFIDVVEYENLTSSKIIIHNLKIEALNNLDWYSDISLEYIRSDISNMGVIKSHYLYVKYQIDLKVLEDLFKKYFYAEIRGDYLFIDTDKPKSEIGQGALVEIRRYLYLAGISLKISGEGLLDTNIGISQYYKGVITIKGKGEGATFVNLSGKNGINSQIVGCISFYDVQPNSYGKSI